MIEPLEPRIAPAAVYVYNDIDGDKVTLTSTLGTDLDLKNAITTQDVLLFKEITKIDFTNKGQIFDGTSLSMTVTRSPNGDGYAHVGSIIATGVDLGTVSIKGDLGQIEVGNATTAKLSIAALTVKSMGIFGLQTQGGAGDLVSNLAGTAGPIVVKGDVINATLQTSEGTLPSVLIGGSLLNGKVSAAVDLGTVKVTRTTLGSSVSAGGNIGPAFFGGDFRFGSITAGKALGAVTIVGSFEAADGDNTGIIRADGGNIASVKIGGDLRGGITSSSSAVSGAILATGDIGLVSIRGSLIGSADVDSNGRSGVIDSGGRIGRVAITGSILSAAANKQFYNGASIHADNDIGSIFVGRDVRGGTGLQNVLFTARGEANPVPGRDIAIGSVIIGGSAFGLYIGGGVPGNDVYNGQGNADAQIGSVTVRGDFLYSNIASGVRPGFFTVATADDAAYTGGSSLTTSIIKRIAIGGAVQADAVAVNSHYGIVSQKIGSLKLAGVLVSLQANAKDVINLGRNQDSFTLREVA